MRWVFVVVAVVAGLAVVWIGATSDAATLRLLVGATVAAFTVAVLTSGSRRLAVAMTVSALAAAVDVVGAFDAVPALIGASVVIFAAPLIAVIWDEVVSRRHRALSREGH
jgi:hypothetical protein